MAHGYSAVITSAPSVYKLKMSRTAAWTGA